MAENYKHLYEQMKKVVGMYQDSIVPGMREQLEKRVEVVQCKDCKSCKLCYPEKQIGKEATPGWYCKKHKSYRRPDDFCSYGERREGE